MLAPAVVYLVVQATNLNYRAVGASSGRWTRNGGGLARRSSSTRTWAACWLSASPLRPRVEPRGPLRASRPDCDLSRDGRGGHVPGERTGELSVAFGGTAPALGLRLCLAPFRDLRDQRSGYDTERPARRRRDRGGPRDPLLERRPESEAVGFTGAATGALLRLASPAAQLAISSPLQAQCEGGSLDIRFLGHACFELSDGSSRVLIDPFLSGNQRRLQSRTRWSPLTSC